jgi:3-hydroxyisobutyrate dehydrogenase
MGSSMCGHLLGAGHDVRVFNRTRASADALLEAGATWCGSPADVAGGSEVTFTIVGYPADVRAVVLGPGGVLEGAAEGSVVVDMTTSEPTLALEIDAAAHERGVESLDAPVSGGDVGARNAALVIMVGGSEPAFERVRPLFESLGKTVVLEGGPGAGQHTKMTNQIAIASGMIGVCEALLYAHGAGLDLERALETISGGAAGSWSLSNYAPRILRGDLEPGFKIDHFLKDLGIALAEARGMGLELPGTTLAEELYRAAREQGYGQKGTHALIVALAARSGADPGLGRGEP